MGARRNNRISIGETIRLRDWFVKHQSEIARRELTQPEVARWAGKDLNLHLTGNNVAAVASERDRALIKFAWPVSRNGGGLGRRPKVVSRGQLRLIVRMIEDLRGALGHEPEGELATLWYALREELNVELTPVRL